MLSSKRNGWNESFQQNAHLCLKKFISKLKLSFQDNYFEIAWIKSQFFAKKIKYSLILRRVMESTGDKNLRADSKLDTHLNTNKKHLFSSTIFEHYSKYQANGSTLSENSLIPGTHAGVQERRHSGTCAIKFQTFATTFRVCISHNHMLNQLQTISLKLGCIFFPDSEDHNLEGA